MKIAPVPQATSAVDPQAARIQSVRSLRMNTNATPGSVPVSATPPPAEEPLTKTDTDDPAPGTVEATQPLSPQLAALAKQKRALQVKERELLDREKALANQPPDQGDGNALLARLKSEPLSVLLEAGVTYDQLTEAILGNQSGNGPEIQALKAEIKALKEDVTKTFTDKDTQAKKQVLAEMQREATSLAAEGDTFELVRETGSIPQVMDLIERTYDTSGEVLDVSEALQLVEDELISESLKLAALKKVQGRLQPEAPPVPQPQQRPLMRTLTNRDGAVAPLSRKERALLAWSGNLPKK